MNLYTEQEIKSECRSLYAILQEVLGKRGESWNIIRTRDQQIIDTGDIVFDVGFEYDVLKNRFDHHQAGRAGTRENGVLYAAAGLIWRHFGRELCNSDDVWQSIDRTLIQELDAGDNGQNYIGPFLFPDSGYTSLGIHIANFGPNNKSVESGEMLKCFEHAAVFARDILTRAIASRNALERSFAEVTLVYQNSPEKNILVFEKNYDRPIWKRLAEFPEPIYAIYPNIKGTGWKIEAIPVSPILMESRKLLPKTWHGLRDEDLQTATGLTDADFCHPSGFLLGTKTLESALLLAKKSLEM
jgi:uncharacterized UPF0160 family protein